MSQLTIGYSDSEDRLWLVVSDDKHQFWLSRRFCANLLTLMARALTESCPGLAIGPRDDPQQRVALEHEAAHEVLVPAEPPPAPSSRRESHLIHSINLHFDAQKVILELMAGNLTRSLHLNRAEAHHVLSTLWQHSQGAGWNLAAPPWVSQLAAPESGE